MSKPANLFPLKLIVISLGFLLVGGTIFVFAAIASKVGKTATISCKGAIVDFHLAGKAHITNIVPETNSLIITLAKDDSTQVITVDRCSGAITQSLIIKP
jgi:hypothetical protein